MIISKNSWHYKLLRLWDKEPYEYRKYSLCEYFWTVVWFTLTTPIVAVGGIMIAIGLLWVLLLSPVIGLISGVIGHPLPFINYDVFWLGLLIDLLLVIVLGIGLFHEDKVIPEWFPKKLTVNKKTENKPNLLFAWLKAKKDKFCPLIEVQEDDK